MTPRQLLQAGLCPVCGRGPFQLPLRHVTLAHGLEARAARVEFGCILTESLCAPEYHRQASERNLARGTRPTAPRRLGTYRCASCGTTFEARRYRDELGIPRYCSIRCKGKAS